MLKRQSKQEHSDHDVYFFEEVTEHAQAWYYSAQTLYESAEWLWKGLVGTARDRLVTHGRMDSHYNSYGLLLGYAVENILKGLWVAQDRPLAKDGHLLPIPGAGDHNLLQLAEAVGATLLHEERGLIDRLSYSILTAGRYPVPPRASDLRPRNGVKPGYFTATEWDALRRMATRLLNELHDQMY